MKNPFWMLRSWLGWLNFFVLQWFFIRLMEVGDKDDQGDWAHLRWDLLWAPVPLTGWWQKYRYLYRGRAARSIGPKELRPARLPLSHLQRRILKELENGPKSDLSIRIHMRAEGFKSNALIMKRLNELVEVGEVKVKVALEGKPWLYRKAERKLDA